MQPDHGTSESDETPRVFEVDRRGGWRRALGRLLLLTSGVLVSLGVAELVLRSAGLWPPRPFCYVGERQSRGSQNFVSDPITGWRMRPEHRFTWTTDGRTVPYESDRHGRRVDPGTPPPRDPRRLFVAGDSFLFGTGVPAGETVGARVAEALGGWSFTNLAMPGFGVDQIWQSVRQSAVPARPDLLIVGVFAEDFDRSRTAYRVKEGFTKPLFKLEGERLVRRKKGDRPGPLWRWLERRSHVFTAARRALEGLGRRYPVGEWWHLNAAILRQLAQDCRAARVPLVFLYVPAADWRPFPMLGRLADELSVPFLDPTALQETAPEGAYFETDQHLNSRGHAWLAQALVKFLRERDAL